MKRASSTPLRTVSTESGESSRGISKWRYMSLSSGRRFIGQPDKIATIAQSRSPSRLDRGVHPTGDRGGERSELGGAYLKRFLPLDTGALHLAHARRVIHHRVVLRTAV